MTGSLPEMATKKNRAAVSLGRRGGQARAKALTAQQRSDAARHAVEALNHSLTPAQRSASARRASAARLAKKKKS